MAITTLGLVASLGRVIQLGGFGEVTSATNLVLEIVINAARILLFLYVLGFANVKTGIVRIKSFLSDKQKRKNHWLIAVGNLKHQWASILLNIVGFSIIVFALNYLIELLAYETCLYLSLKKDGILAESSSEWTILLFFKNLSTIPFTLIFQTFFILWITNKLSHTRTAQ